MPRGMKLHETDVFVAGGGPAGLAAAIAARGRGFRVLVADGGHPPIDKPCGEGLMPDALVALRALGISIGPEHGSSFRGIRFLGAGRSVDANFPDGFGMGVRRTTLHELLIRRAEEVGVAMRWGSRISGLSAAGVRLDDKEVRCRWVVGADGQKSQVRRWAGLDGYRRESSRFAFRRHYRMAPWTDCMEIYWGASCQMYVTPVGAGEVCVTVISRRPQMKLEDVLPAFPEISRRLAGVAPATSERGSVTVTRSLKRVAGGRVILIGDASGSVDAITGEGLCLAFRQAAALADALESGDLAAYEARHRRLERRPAFMAGLMLTLDRSPWLCRRALRALSSKPAIFSLLLAMHVGALAPAELISGVAPAGWRILTPGGGEL